MLIVVEVEYVQTQQVGCRYQIQQPDEGGAKKDDRSLRITLALVDSQ